MDNDKTDLVDAMMKVMTTDVVKCDHKDSNAVPVEIFGSVVWKWYCKDCSRIAFADYAGAKHLGWVVEEQVVEEYPE